jgi:hypothetical protein
MWRLIRRHPLIPTDRSFHFSLLYLVKSSPAPCPLYPYRSRSKQEGGENYIIRRSILFCALLLLPYFSINNLLKMNMRGMHLKGMRDKSNVRQKYYLTFIEH